MNVRLQRDDYIGTPSMAKVNNIMMDQMQGSIGQQICFKNYKYGTVASKKPDMSRVVPSARQLQEKGRFGEAVRFAQGVIKDPEKKAAYKVEEGKSVCHAAIKDYLEKNK